MWLSLRASTIHTPNNIAKEAAVDDGDVLHECIAWLCANFFHISIHPVVMKTRQDLG
jgi:hypothetical protein